MYTLIQRQLRTYYSSYDNKNKEWSTKMLFAFDAFAFLSTSNYFCERISNLYCSISNPDSAVGAEVDQSDGIINLS